MLALGVVCAIIIAIDVARRPQHMWIMDVVWPVTALFGTVWIAWQYFAYVRLDDGERPSPQGDRRLSGLDPRKLIIRHRRFGRMRENVSRAAHACL